MDHNLNCYQSYLTKSVPTMVSLFWYYFTRGCIGLFTVVGNTIVIFLIVSRKRLHKTTNWFILSLSCADLCVGAALIPVHFVCALGELQCNWEIVKVSHSVILSVSVGNLCILTADRYIAIVHSLQYRMIMTGRRGVTLISLAWVIPSLGTLAPSIWLWASKGDKKTIFNILNLCIICLFEIFPCVFMALVHLQTILISRQHSQRNKRQQQQLAFNHSGNGSCANCLRRKKEKSAYCATLLVVLLFILTWLLSAYRTFCVYVLSSCRVERLTTLISRLLMLSHSGLNPFIWALLKKDIRRELIKLLRPCCGTTCPCAYSQISFSMCHVPQTRTTAGSLVQCQIVPRTQNKE